MSINNIINFCNCFQNTIHHSYVTLDNLSLIRYNKVTTLGE